MSDPAEDVWFQERLSNLQISDDRLNGLSEIQEKLRELNPQRIAQVSNKVPLSTVFACVEKVPR